MATVVIILQARMTSTRLPGKVLMPVLDYPLLAVELARLQCVKQAQQLVVATTTQKTDDPIEALCKRLNVSCFRGDEDDVLSRYCGAAAFTQADSIIRVTGDCPLIDPTVVDAAIALYLSGEFDYVSNTMTRTYPRGLDVEVFSFDALEQANREAVSVSHREHVTPFFYTQPKRFRLGELKQTGDHHDHRWTVDTPEDFQLISKVLSVLLPRHGPLFSTQDVLDVLRQNPEWRLINSDVVQKIH
ncbi:MAG: glycosyltransferase family protein [Cyanobacteria bacterium P01_H01_bin.74]